MATGEKKDHDTNVSVEEVLQRIAAAEALLAEARSMLTGKTRVTASDVAPDEPPSRKVPVPTGDSEFDEILLSRYAPPGRDDDYRASILGLFQLVLDPPADRDHLAEALRRQMHSQAVIGKRALEGVLRFGWVRFSKYSHQYLSKPEDAASFSVLKTEPSDLSDATEIKVFVDAKGRSPVPISLRRDEAFDKAWRVKAFSL